MIDINWLRQQALMSGYGQPDAADSGDGSGVTDYTPIDTSNLWGEQIQSPSDDPTNRGTFPGTIQPPPVPNVPSYSASADGLDPQTRAEIARQKAIADTFYTPDTTSRDRFGKMIDNAPDVTKYNPGLLRTIGSIGMSMGPGGYKAAEESQYSPFMREAAMWKEKIGPAQQAATIENTSNNIERQIAGQATAGITASERNAANERIATEKAKVAQSKVDSDREIGLIRARADDYMKRLGHGWQFDTTGPSVIAMNKDDPSQNFDTGIETGKLDEMTRKAMENYGKIEAAKQLGANAAGVAAVRATGYWRDPDGNLYQVGPGGKPVPVADAPEQPTGQLTPVPTGARAGSGTGKGAGGPVEDLKNYDAVVQVRMRAVHDNKSEFSDLFKIDDKGNYSMVPRPGYGWFSLDATDEAEMARWDEARKLVFPNYQPPTKKDAAPAAAAATPPAPPQASPGATQGLGASPSTIDKGIQASRYGLPQQPPQQGRDIVDIFRDLGANAGEFRGGPSGPMIVRPGQQGQPQGDIGQPPQTPQQRLKPGEVLIENAATGEPKAVPAASVEQALAIRNPDGSLKYRKYTGGG